MLRLLIGEAARCRRELMLGLLIGEVEMREREGERAPLDTLAVAMAWSASSEASQRQGEEVKRKRNK